MMELDWISCVNKWASFERSLVYRELHPAQIVGLVWDKQADDTWSPFLVIGDESRRVPIDPDALKQLILFLAKKRFPDVEIRFPTSWYWKHDSPYAELVRSVLTSSVAPPQDPTQDSGYKEICDSPPVCLYSDKKIIAVVSAQYTIVCISDSLSNVPPERVEPCGWKVMEFYLSPDVSFLRVYNPTNNISLCFVNGYTGREAVKVYMGIGVVSNEQRTWIDMILPSKKGTGFRVIHRGRLASELDVADFFSPEMVSRMQHVIEYLQNKTLTEEDIDFLRTNLKGVNVELRPNTPALAAIQAISRALIGNEKDNNKARRLLVARRCGQIAVELLQRERIDPGYNLWTSESEAW